MSLAHARALDRSRAARRGGRCRRRARVAGMLVLLADRLDEADVLEVARLLVRRLRQLVEVQLVLEVRPAGRARRVVGVVVERLVVELEQAVRAVRVGVGSVFGARRAVRRVAAVRAGAVRSSRGPAGRRRLPAALSQPPEYHAQSTPAADSSSPIVTSADGSGGSRRRHRRARRVRLVERLGRVDGVVAAHERRLQRRPARGRAARLGQLLVLHRRAQRRGVERVRCSASRSRRATEWRSSAEPSFSAPDQVGVAAATSHWWFRNEPPNARLEEVVRDRVVGMRPSSCRYCVDRQGLSCRSSPSSARSRRCRSRSGPARRR